MKAYRCRSSAPLILNLCTRWRWIEKRHTLHHKFIFMVDLTFSDRSENFKVQPNLFKVCKYTKAFFYTCLFYAFCFNAPYQFTPLLNMWSHFQFNTVWLVYMHLLKLFFSSLREYHDWFMPTFSGTKLGHKTRHWCISNFKLFTHPTKRILLWHDMNYIKECTFIHWFFSPFVITFTR